MDHEHPNNFGNDDAETIEQYRIMAQIEANIRVKDNTGFDMAEYQEQQLRLEKERAKEDELLRRCHTNPKPRLPEIKFSGSLSRSSLSDNVRPEEPPLPFTRANRRYGQSGKNSKDRETVPELCQGVLVTTPMHLETSASSCSKETALQCLGCSEYLKVNSLAMLVQCPECLTISPVT